MERCGSLRRLEPCRGHKPCNFRREEKLAQQLRSHDVADSTRCAASTHCAPAIAWCCSWCWAEGGECWRVPCRAGLWDWSMRHNDGAHPSGFQGPIDHEKLKW